MIKPSQAVESSITSNWLFHGAYIGSRVSAVAGRTNLFMSSSASLSHCDLTKWLLQLEFCLASKLMSMVV